MDFGTMRKKIVRGDYISLDLFQNDIFLICSNAMRYNARDTIYYKQARSILDATRKILEALRTGLFIGDQKALGKQWAGGSSAKKSFKKPPTGKILCQPTGSDYASGVTLATGGESGTWLPDSVNDGKGLILDKAGSACWNVNSQAVRGSSSLPSEVGNDKQDVLAGCQFRPIMLKEGRRPACDENRRNSYRPYSPQSYENVQHLVALGGEKQLQLIPMGHQPEYAYARSLARFAGDLGPAVWKVAVGKIGNALPKAVPFGPGWIGEQEAMAGCLPNRLSKEQVELSKQSESQTTMAAEIRQSGYQRQDHPVSNSNSAKSLTELQSASVKVTSSVAASVVPEKSVLPNEKSVTGTENFCLQNLAQAMQFSQSSTGESIKLSAGAAKFESSELSQSKLLELVSQKSKLMQWAAGKQLKQDPQSLPSIIEQRVHERGTEVCEDTDLTSNDVSHTAEGALDISKNDFDLRSGQTLQMSTLASSQDACIQNLNLSSSGSEQQQLSQGLLKKKLQHLCSTSGPTSVVLLTTGVTSASMSICREDRGKQLCLQPQATTATDMENDMITTLESQLPGSAIQHQMGGVPQLVLEQKLAHQLYEDQVRSKSQLYDRQRFLSSFPQNKLRGDAQLISQNEAQPRLGHQWQHECQVMTTSQLYDSQRPFSVQHQMGGMSQLEPQDNSQIGLGHQLQEQQSRMSHMYDNQRLLSSSQFMQHQMPCDTSFVQQQPVHFHPQGLSKLTSPLVPSGSPSSSALHDTNLMSLHPRFSNPMVARLPSLSQPWRFVSLQYPLPQTSHLSHSLPPDLNVSLQTIPKSPLDQPLNSLADSQQPDLALQL
eukprot:c28561_g1_i2 orf=1026-3512(+)